MCLSRLSLWQGPAAPPARQFEAEDSWQRQKGFWDLQPYEFFIQFPPPDSSPPLSLLLSLSSLTSIVSCSFCTPGNQKAGVGRQQKHAPTHKQTYLLKHSKSPAERVNSSQTTVLGFSTFQCYFFFFFSPSPPQAMFVERRQRNPFCRAV